MFPAVFCFLRLFTDSTSMHGGKMQMYNDNDIAPIEIDLGMANRGEVTESWLRMLGFGIESIMKAMFGGSAVPVRVKGSKREVSSFAKALSREKKYMQSAAKYGLNDPRTYKNKFKLNKSLSQFERTTGLKWPFKD